MEASSEESSGALKTASSEDSSCSAETASVGGWVGGLVSLAVGYGVYGFLVGYGVYGFLEGYGVYFFGFFVGYLVYFFLVGNLVCFFGVGAVYVLQFLPLAVEEPTRVDGPQSAQSVPGAQSLKSAPPKPSSQTPSLTKPPLEPPLQLLLQTHFWLLAF